MRTCVHLRVFYLIMCTCSNKLKIVFISEAFISVVRIGNGPRYLVFVRSRLITARVRSTTGGYVFIGVSVNTGVPWPGQDKYTHKYTLARDGVSPHPGMGYPPSQVQRWGRGYPSQWWGTPCPEIGYPLPPLSRDGVPPPLQGYDNRLSTWYAAGGMPLAFTQEDCLMFVFACASIPVHKYTIVLFLSKLHDKMNVTCCFIADENNADFNLNHRFIT